MLVSIITNNSCTFVTVKKEMRQYIHTYLKWLLPILFTIYYCDIAVFLHAHFEDGEVYQHSHPFCHSDGDTPHTHNSLTERLFIQELSSLHIVDGLVCELRLDFYIPPFYILIENQGYQPYSTPFFGNHSLRAPPFIG